MPYVNLDVELDDIIGSLSQYEMKDLCKTLIENGWAPETWIEEHTPPETLALEDEVIRLDAITWLRANGYTVEPK